MYVDGSYKVPKTEINLLEETIAILWKHHLESYEVGWIENSEISFTWEEFAELARDFNYDPSCNFIPSVNQSLRIYGSYWHLKRIGGYGEPERWDFVIPIRNRPSGRPGIKDIKHFNGRCLHRKDLTTGSNKI